MWFYEFFQLSFSKFTLFLFLVIACASYSKFIKSLQASVQKVNFMNLLNLISGGFLLFVPTLSRLVNQNISSLIDCRSIWFESFMYV